MLIATAASVIDAQTAMTALILRTVIQIFQGVQRDEREFFRAPEANFGIAGQGKRPDFHRAQFS